MRDLPQAGQTLTDCARRFLFDNADLRGETVHLDDAFRAVLNIHQYASGVGRLLGEFLAAAVLLSSTLKFQGKLILQARSEVTASAADGGVQLRPAGAGQSLAEPRRRPGKEWRS